MKPRPWVAYLVRDTKAVWLGRVEAPTMEEAIAVAAAEHRVPACRIMVQLVLDGGEVIGEVVIPKPAGETDHFLRCPGCGGWFDIRDLAQVMEHAGPLPHPAGDKPQ